MQIKPCANSHEFRCDLVNRIIAKQDILERWYELQNRKAPAPIYTSIDLRDSGFKVSPVDSNIFPAGFNNICPDDWGLAASTFERVLTRANRDRRPERILVIPENHTTNLFYFENLWALREILTIARFEVILGHVNPELAPNMPKGCTSEKTASGQIGRAHV